jgi:uncharacterized protein involved in exopolysaccharide biosynthesis
METQTDIIRSRRVASAALSMLPDDLLRTFADERLGDYEFSTLKEGTSWEKLITSALDELVVLTTRESRVIALQFRSETPTVAAALADAFANAYIEVSLDLSITPARRNAVWFDTQLVTLRNRLAEKQAALTAYQKEKGIISYDERLDSEMARYEAMSADLVRAQTRTYEVRASQIGAQHPEYRRAVEQEQAIRVSVEQQERRVFQAKEERDALELLVQDVENARRSYDIALQEFYQNSMESQFNQTNVAVLSPATVPSEAAGPGSVVRLLGSLVLGLMLGTLLAVAAELVNRKIRTEDDIREGIGLRVIASI